MKDSYQKIECPALSIIITLLEVLHPIITEIGVNYDTSNQRYYQSQRDPFDQNSDSILVGSLGNRTVVEEQILEEVKLA